MESSGPLQLGFVRHRTGGGLSRCCSHTHCAQSCLMKPQMEPWLIGPPASTPRRPDVDILQRSAPPGQTRRWAAHLGYCLGARRNGGAHRLAHVTPRLLFPVSQYLWPLRVLPEVHGQSYKDRVLQCLPNPARHATSERKRIQFPRNPRAPVVVLTHARPTVEPSVWQAQSRY